MTGTTSFGQWLKRRRKALDITQEELAQRVGCAVVTIYKIEAGERRPSKQIARLLAEHLAIPATDWETFVNFARTGAKTVDSAAPWGTPFHPPTNLPTPPTPLIGRESDISSVKQRLLRDDTQLLTLVGPPGIGKTRLSLAVSAGVLDEFSDGVFLVLLAPVSDPDLMLRTIIQTLGLQETGPQSSLERLTHHLRDKQMLLVLDNFEQILPAATNLADLLAACPFVKVLVTSRAPLRIRRERQYLVPVLETPEVDRDAEIESLPTYAAIELFIERAQAVQHDFALTPDNAQHISAICNRLDGLPLAIELISARVKLLPPAALLERLHGQLMLHSDGLRDLEPRHRTLNAAIGWSYDLLDEAEKTLFMRLGVFVGGWTIEAVEEICQHQVSALDSIALLLDKSLIQPMIDGSDIPRYMMLETVREYALQRLEASGTRLEVQQRHAHYFLKLAETPYGNATPALSQAAQLDRIERDYDNIRAALDWGFANDLETGVNLMIAVSGYWIQRGRLVEGRFWAEQLVDICLQREGVSSDQFQRIIQVAGNLAYFHADIEDMRRHAQTLLSLGEPHGYFLLGQDAMFQENFDDAQVSFEKCLAGVRQLGRFEHTASTLLMLALAAEGQQNYSRALALNEECLAMYRQLGNRWLESFALSNSGDVLMLQGNYKEARALCHQSLSISREINDRRTIARILEQFAQLIELDGDALRATRLMGAAEALRNSISARVEPLERRKYDRLVVQLHENLDETAFDRAWAEGRLLTMEQAIDLALVNA